MLAEETLVPAAPQPSRALQHRLFSLLQTCDSAAKLSQIHAQLITNVFYQKGFLVSKLISLYTTFGFFRLARHAFDQLATPGTSAWNQMIRLSYAHGESPADSVRLYNRMRKEGSAPDAYTYSYALTACLQFGMLREGKQIHGRLISDGYSSNVVIGTSLVNLYASRSGGNDDDFLSARKVFDELSDRNMVTWNSLLAAHIRRGDFDSAIRVFDEMPERSVVSWTTMISGCARNGQCRQALSFFNEMRRAPVELDQVALIAALSACSDLGDLNLGKWIHSYVNKTYQGRKRALHVPLQNALIHMYASCGGLDEAYGIFKEIPCQTIVSWTSMITGYAKHGYAAKALSLFKMMQDSTEANQIRPDAITFLGVLCACSHAGLVEESRAYFKEMKDRWGIEPRIEHYGCMVDLLSRAGFLDEAQGLVESMPMMPNNAIWGALLGGCRIHKNIELASHAAHHLMLELDPHQAMGYLLLLSNVYALDRRWKDAAAVKEKMVHIGMQKPPGRSWIQVNGTIHDFAAGDWNHKHVSSIYEILHNINGQIMNDVCDNGPPRNEDNVNVANLILT